MLNYRIIYKVIGTLLYIEAVMMMWCMGISLYMREDDSMAFIIASASGVLFVKLMNLFLSGDKKINPLIGNAGVSAVPMSARISNNLGLEYDRHNFLLMHAMGPNVAGVIGSAVAAGTLLGFFS